MTPNPFSEVELVSTVQAFDREGPVAYVVEIEGRGRLLSASGPPSPIEAPSGARYLHDGRWLYRLDGDNPGPLDLDRPYALAPVRTRAPRPSEPAPPPLFDPLSGIPYPEPHRVCRSCGVNVLSHVLLTHEFAD